MDDNDNNNLAAITDWLQHCQGMPKTTGQDSPFDTLRTASGASDLLQSKLADLDFDSEPTQFLRLLHKLAPVELRGDDE